MVLIIWGAYYNNDANITEIKGPTRQDRIFSVLNRSGLTQVFPEMLTLSNDITYKNAGFYLFHSFLKDEANRDKYIVAMQNLVVVDSNIAVNSQSSIYYLLAKAEQILNNQNKATEYFRKSEGADLSTYKYLMEQDLSYDTASLRTWLQKDLQQSILTKYNK